MSQMLKIWVLNSILFKWFSFWIANSTNRKCNFIKNEQQQYNLINIIQMELKSDLNIDFEQLYQQQKNKPLLTYRQEYIGPWAQHTNFFSPQKNQIKYQTSTKPKKYFQNSQKNIQALCNKSDMRQRFRTAIHKIESAQKFSQFDDKFQKIKKICALDLQQKKQDLSSFTKYQPFRINRPAIKNESSATKKALNTTMYVYHYKQKPRKLSKNQRNASLDPELDRKRQSQALENQVSLGSKNLQKILKMKERLRAKNHNLVRKIKQKQIQSDKQITLKHLIQAQQMRNTRTMKWRSTTLDHQNKPHKYQLSPLSPGESKPNELKRFYPFQYNKAIIQSDLNLFGRSNTKFFHKV